MEIDKSFALFLGCTIPARSRHYEISARKVAEKLNLTFVDIPEFSCCGFPLKSIDGESSLLMNARNLSYAEEKGLNICTLCSSCTSAMTEDAHLLNNDATLRKKINRELSKIGKAYHGNIEVRHIARILFEDIGPENISNLCVNPLSGLKVAIHNGCHYLKPKNLYKEFDDPEDPKSIATLVKATGAEVVQFPGAKKCCGGPALAVNEDIALSIAKQKLEKIKETEANCIVLVCPFCAVMYDTNQRSIEEKYQIELGIPVLYLTQLLGMAMGFTYKELGLNLNKVKVKKFLSEYIIK